MARLRRENEDCFIDVLRLGATQQALSGRAERLVMQPRELTENGT